MKWQYISRLGIVLGSLLMPQTAHAQSQGRLEACSASPTPRTRVQIVAVTFRGNPHLASAIQEQIVSALKQKDFYEDRNSVADFEGAARDAVQDQGYFAVLVKAEPHVVKSDPLLRQVRVDLDVQPGLQYRLGSLCIIGSTVFTREELCRLIPPRPGELFSVLRVRKGIQALAALYSTEGYIDLTVEPNTAPERDRRHISLTLKLVEDGMYRVGEITILGLDPQVERSLSLKLKPGDPLDNRLVGDFFRENQAILPAVASQWLDAQFKRDSKNHKVDIVFDFRPCPKK